MLLKAVRTGLSQVSSIVKGLEALSFKVIHRHFLGNFRIIKETFKQSFCSNSESSLTSCQSLSSFINYSG